MYHVLIVEMHRQGYTVDDLAKLLRVKPETARRKLLMAGNSDFFVDEVDKIMRAWFPRAGYDVLFDCRSFEELKKSVTRRAQKEKSPELQLRA